MREPIVSILLSVVGWAGVVGVLIGAFGSFTTTPGGMTAFIAIMEWAPWLAGALLVVAAAEGLAHLARIDEQIRALRAELPDKPAPDRPFKDRD